ncbi:MAG: glycoside hydrolase family 57 protein [Bacteroidales bacterium]|nr:glycoside hydrolase family 57 protein [Bacteroidales bacterium]
MKPSICLYFQVHQPDRLRQYRFFDIGKDSHYFDDFSNRTIVRRVAEKCYLPMNAIMLENINKLGKSFKIAYSISGSAIEQFEQYAPEVLDSFKALAATGCVEFLAETYTHSLASLVSKDEFKKQVELHSKAIEKHFGKKPKCFRNTELIYSDEIGEMVYKLGFKGMLTEGAKHILGWKSPNYVYSNANNPKLKVLLRNFTLSDDIAFRFSDKGWNEWPLDTNKFTSWVADQASKDEIINLFMDYETFGEHQSAASGIFDFMRALPEALLNNANVEFVTPSEAIKKHDAVSPINVPFSISWADEERDTSAWLGNELQNEAFSKLYDLSDRVLALQDDKITKDYMKLQESDHFYYMCTKFFSDGAVHTYFNPYDTPYEAFINYMNVLSDLIIRIERKLRLG